MEGFMSNGTAVNMADPNSMRDQGGTRNAVYNGAIRFSETKSMKRTPCKQFLRRDGASNNTFYSFGGSKFIRDETDQDDHLLNPVFRDYSGKVIPQDTVIFRKDLNQRVSDYTKNISQSIFSPGELLNHKVVDKFRTIEARNTYKKMGGSQGTTKKITSLHKTPRTKHVA